TKHKYGEQLRPCPLAPCTQGEREEEGNPSPPSTGRGEEEKGLRAFPVASANTFPETAPPPAENTHSRPDCSSEWPSHGRPDTAAPARARSTCRGTGCLPRIPACPG